MESLNEPTCEPAKLDPSVTVPSELLSVVDALCHQGARNSCGSPVDGSKGINVNDKGRNTTEDDNRDKSSCITQRKRTFDKMNEVIKFDITSNISDFRESVGLGFGGSDNSAMYSSNTETDLGYSGHPIDAKRQLLQTIGDESPSEPNQTINPKTEFTSKRNINIPTYAMDGKNIVILPDVYRVVREACGTCNPLRSEVNKLGIVPKRFDPLQMIRLKKVEAVNLDVKCCSYILLEEFLQLITKYKDKMISPGRVNILPPVSISSQREAIGSVDDKPTRPNASFINKIAASSASSLHTFIIADELVVCTVEFQPLFESLFGNIFSMSLAKLGICQFKLTPLQLDEVMDFVDIDESNITAIYYILKKDADRLFRYAEALFNVEGPQVNWLDPLRLSRSAEHIQVDQMSTLLARSSSQHDVVNSKSNVISRVEGQSIIGVEEEVSENSAFEQNCHIDISDDLQETPSSESLPEKEKMIQQAIASKETCNLDSLLASQKSQTIESKSEQLKQSLRDDTLSDEDVSVSLEISTVDLITSPEDQGTPSSFASEACDFSDSDSCSSIHTYLIDANEVVCIPDIHKIVIHLYGQSVQVGYYLQRLQIPTQRFSTVHVKRLKALRALNSKATLCTYILKSDALRLLKMYDVFCTDSKLHYIQWHGPTSLEGLQTGILPSNEATASSKGLTTAHESPHEVVKIPTFLINGEIVVSVPDAHKVVQVLNGQSVQVRYNMDKLGIIKRRYSYSQVYQLRAISDLKRPSMCTFITKSDADKLLDHYLTAENASRLKYIQWSPPVRLEQLPRVNEEHSSNSSQDYSTCAIGPVDVQNCVGLDENEIQQSDLSFGQNGLETSDLYEQAKEPTESSVENPTEVASMAEYGLQSSVEREIQETTADEVHNVPDKQPECNTQEVEPPVIQMASFSQECENQCCAATGSTERAQHIENCQTGKKRTFDEVRHKESLCLEVKRLRVEKNEIAATLERKETEMRILHDAYQQQVACEREKRLVADKQAEELKVSNMELRKTLQRKESEMKILHDSYQFQIRKEREKREELENDLIDLRGSVAYASGVSIGDPNIKQESL